MNAAVLVINWNSGPYLRALVGSLSEIATDLQAILVLDNGSADGSPLELPPCDHLEVEQLGENRGFATAANLGISRLQADWIFLLNPDVVATSRSLRRLYLHALEAQDCAIVCGPLLGMEDDRWQASFQCRTLPTAWSTFKDALFLEELLALFDPPPPDPEIPHHPFEIEQPAAAYWLLKKNVWQESGGFDEAFFPAWFEDVDFCRRLKDSGWRIRCFPDCPLRHAGGISVHSLGRVDFSRIYYRNLDLYLRKHHPYSAPWLRPAVRLGSWIRQRHAS